jgi:hypothetical protein
MSRENFLWLKTGEPPHNRESFMQSMVLPGMMLDAYY